MKILFSGGGTLGPVTPLLAVAEDLSGHELLWIGTYRGPERTLVEQSGIRFRSIAAGKLRRYVSLWTLLDPLLVLIGFVQSLAVLFSNRPDVIVSAGGYVSVPVVIAGWLLRIPAIIHQMDVAPVLANRIMAPFARRITVAVPETAAAFDQRKTTVVGNPVRRAIENVRDRPRATKSRPLVLVLGGGTGAQAINDAIGAVQDELLAVADVTLVTGKNKFPSTLTSLRAERSNREKLKTIEFASDDLPDLYASADVVVTRGGMGTISEILALNKPSVVVPIPHSPQEANAEFLVRHGHAVLVRQDEPDFSRRLLHAIRHTLDAERDPTSHRTPDAARFGEHARQELVNIILSVHNELPNRGS